MSTCIAFRDHPEFHKAYHERRQPIQVSIGGQHVFVLNNGYCWAFGRNHHGQLGLGHTNNQETPVLLKTFIESHGAIDEVITNGNHSFFRVKQRWFACGENTHGQLCTGNQESYLEPVSLSGFENRHGQILKLIAREEHTFLLTAQGWFAVGNNIHGQLLLHHQDPVIEPTALTTCVDNFGPIEELVAGFDFTFLKTAQGWRVGGNQALGQTGLGPGPAAIVPVLLDGFTNQHGAIQKIVPGYQHSFIQSVPHPNYYPVNPFAPNLGGPFWYGQGANHLGQLALRDLVPHPTPAGYGYVENVDDINRIARWVTHRNRTFYQCLWGHWYAEGWDQDGELLLGRREPRTYSVEREELEQRHGRIRDVYLGEDFTLAETEKAWIIAGNNAHGQLGLGHREAIAEPENHPLLNRLKAPPLQLSLFRRKESVKEPYDWDAGRPMPIYAIYPNSTGNQ